MDSALFSVVVPVYNVREYLAPCVQSVQRQTQTHWEMLLVDDGSTDGCAQLCDRFAKEDARIHVIHQQNAGAAAARNTGLSAATGEWILFLDGDDFYACDDALQQIENSIDDAVQMVCFNYARYTSALQKAACDCGALPAHSPAQQVKKQLVQSGAYTSSACLKAVRREVLNRLALKFADGTLSEDVAWSARLLCEVDEIRFVPQVLYAYRVRETSLTNNVTPRHVQDLYSTVHSLALNVRKDEAYKGYVGFQYATLMINARICSPKIQRELRGKIKADAWLLQWRLCPQVRMVYTASRVLGYNGAGWLLKTYFQFTSRVRHT